MLALVSGTVPVLAQQQDIPPGAQPGSQERDLRSPLPVPTEEFSFRIPPMYDRPLGVDQGARVFVHGFRLSGILQDPDAPDLKAEARRAVEEQFRESLEVIEEMRIERQRIGDVGPDGFTPDERARVMEFMLRALREMDPEERVENYQQLVDELGQTRLEREQGLTIGQIQQIADAVTEIYRERGFFLSRAIVPAQEVTDGIVDIRVLEGRLGATHIEGNDLYRAETLRRPFEPLEGKLITAGEVESALFSLSDYPGLLAFGTFRPGEEVGTADIAVNVINEEQFDFAYYVDNYGTEFTGKNRVSVDMAVNNNFSVGDRVSLSLMKSYRPENTLTGQFIFETPVGSPQRKVRVEVARNTFDISGRQFTGAGFAGISHSGRVAIEQALVRGRNYNFYLQYDFTRKQGETTQLGITINQDDLAVHGLQVRFDRVIAETNSLSSGFLRFDLGHDGILNVPTVREVEDPLSDINFSRQGATPRFNKITAGYSRLKLFNTTHSLLFRFNGQFTNDLLTSLEQYSLGGAEQVRGSPAAIFLGDKGAYGSLEWIMRAPGFADKPGVNGHNWGEVLSFSLFTDHTVAYINEPIREDDRRFQLSGYGLGVNLQLPGSWGTRIEHARLRGGERPGTGPNDPFAIPIEHQTWVEFSHSF